MFYHRIQCASNSCLLFRKCLYAVLLTLAKSRSCPFGDAPMLPVDLIERRYAAEVNYHAKTRNFAIAHNCALATNELERC